MAQAVFRFYAELNELLPVPCRFRDVVHSFHPPVTMKDCIESFGVPHTDVELIQVNGASVGFDYRLQDGDRVSVYPFMAVLENPHPLRPPPPRGRFVLDQHLARLAAYLRLLGLDALHRVPFPDEELARVSVDEDRVLLTRDRGLLMRKEVVHGTFVRSTRPKDQVVEVLHRFGRGLAVSPFTRCMACNEVLVPADKAQIFERLPSGTREAYHTFRACPACGRIYWDGPHVRRMRGWIDVWLCHPDLTLSLNP
jgi:hypothetical protein